MALTPEEIALFGPPDPVPQAELEPAAVLPADAPPSDASTPPPERKRGRPSGSKNKAPLIMPDCADCGASLTPDNSSKLQAGGFKHIGCAGTTAAPVAAVPAQSPFIAAVLAPNAFDGPAALVIPKEKAIRIELGPETLAALRALLGK